MSIIPYFLENRLTDGGEVSSIMWRPRFILQEDSCTNFCSRRSKLKGHSVAGRIRFFFNPLLFASCTDTVKLLEA
jgi:hypothetical protein